MTAPNNGEPGPDEPHRAPSTDEPSVSSYEDALALPGAGEPIETVACGADTDELLEQVANGQADALNAHQRDCVHCQAALREFADLWAPISASTRTPVAVPEGFVASVMGRVRAVAADTWYTLELTDGGKITIAARVVAQLARNAARTVPGVRVALGRSTTAKLARIVERATLGHRHLHSAVGVLGRTAVVDLALAVSYGDPAHEVARRVQHVVTKELRAGVGLKSVTVNVCVDDVLEGEQPAQP